MDLFKLADNDPRRCDNETRNEPQITVNYNATDALESEPLESDDTGADASETENASHIESPSHVIRAPLPPTNLREMARRCPEWMPASL